MATIDIGNTASSRSTGLALVNTNVDRANAANNTGVLTSFEIWLYLVNGTGVKIGTFSGSGSSHTNRDYETIGNVTAGSKQTFTGKNCDVSSGDFIGVYGTDGYVSSDDTGGSGVFWKAGDQFGAGTQTYTQLSGDRISLYATGETAAAGNPYYYYLQQ